LDYYTSGGTAGCPALLVEPSAQNGAPNVQYLRGVDTPAVSGGLTITTGSTDFLAPDGTSASITKYVGGAASGSTQYAYYTGFSPTTSASGVYTASLFVKAGATNPINFCALQFINFAGASGTATSYFSLASGTALTSGATIQNYGNGWYRIISAPYTIAAGDLSGNVFFSLAEANNDINWPASGALNLTAYAWGAQIEAGSVATSYIPTTTAAVTRNADVVSLSGAVSGCIGQTQGTIYAEVDLKNKGVSLSRVIYLSDGTSNNEIRISHSVTTAGDLQIAIRLAGSLVVNQTSPTAVYFGINKIAVGYKVGTNEVVMYVNGSQIILSTSSGNMPACNTIHLGSQLGTSNFLNDRIRAAALYTTRLTNAELATLTTP
jgi:hypothetical protein